MKTSELIRLLQEADPSGEVECCIDNHDIYSVELWPAFYDGALEILVRDPSLRPYYDIVNRCKINLQTGKAIGWMKLPSPTEFPGRDSIHPGGDESDTIFSSAFRLFVKSDVLG